MEKIVPLPGSTVRGPLGVAGLPRLWLKRILAISDLLPEGYTDGYSGTSRIVIDGIGLDPQATLAKLSTQPPYLEFEWWIREHARGFEPAAVDATNAAVRARASTLTHALRDWSRVHEQVTAARSAAKPTIVPAISSQSSGPLGLQHLPRLWLKATLAATGALFDGWKSGAPSPFDVWFARAADISLEATVAHIGATLPAYPEFERWFAATASRVSPAEIERQNAEMVLRQKPDVIAAEERALLGIADPTYAPSIELNDLVDWHQLHAMATLRRAGT